MFLYIHNSTTQSHATKPFTFSPYREEMELGTIKTITKKHFQRLKQVYNPRNVLCGPRNVVIYDMITSNSA